MFRGFLAIYDQIKRATTLKRGTVWTGPKHIVVEPGKWSCENHDLISIPWNVKHGQPTEQMADGGLVLKSLKQCCLCNAVILETEAGV